MYPKSLPDFSLIPGHWSLTAINRALLSFCLCAFCLLSPFLFLLTRNSKPVTLLFRLPPSLPRETRSLFLPLCLPPFHSQLWTFWWNSLMMVQCWLRIDARYLKVVQLQIVMHVLHERRFTHNPPTPEWITQLCRSLRLDHLNRQY